MKALSAASHVAALTGLYLASVAWFAILNEGLHVSHVTGHRLGPAGQVLCNVVSDGPSPVMNVFALCLVVTMALVVITQTRLSRAADAAGRFLSGYPACLALWLAAMLAPTLLLWWEDFRYIPEPLYGAPNPRPWALLGVPCFTFPLGIASAIMCQVTRRPAYLCGASLVPLLAAVAAPFAFPARGLEETWRMCLPGSYPRLGWVLSAAGVLLALHLPVFLLWRRAAGNATGAAVAAAVLAGWCWLLMAATVLGAMMPYHYGMLGLRNPHAGVQESAVRWMMLVFAFLWAAIGAVQWARCRARAHRPA